MKEKIVLIGAGSAVFTKGLVADLINTGWDAELVLVDIDPQAMEIAEKMSRKMAQASKSAIRISAGTDRRAVLRGATCVVCTIGVGGRRAWEQDVFVPRRHGIYQPVGDTAGAGGSSRALRMIAAMVDIARDVMDLAPNALFFNYGNPMSPVCRGVRKATGAPMIGLCHGVFYVARFLAEVLDVPLARLHYTATGINHMSWFTGLYCDGVDRMPQLRAEARRRMHRGLSSDTLGQKFDEAGTEEGRTVKEKVDDYPFSWWLTDLFGAFPAVFDRHITEFFPQFFADGAYYGKKLGVDAYTFEGTIAHGDRNYQRMSEVALSPGPLPDDFNASFQGEHEQVLATIASIRKNLGHVYSVNLPNRGQVPNLPMEAVIECPAVADNAGIRAIQLDPLPAALAGTLATRFAWVETIVEAALEGSREKFIQALVLDGSVRSPSAAVALADDLLAAQAAYLPQFKHPQP